MKVFISWSGETSLKVAQKLRDWLPFVINEIEPYVSSEDIDKGARWSTDIAKELADSSFGIICVTKDNLQAPWLSFEAGALSKTMDKAYVAPFLFDIKRSEVQGPILQFQSTVFEKEDIRKMLKTLNKACGESGITESRLDKAFDVWYPTLEKDLKDLRSMNIEQDPIKKKTIKEHSTEILEEILELSRDNQRLLRTPDSQVQNDINEIKTAIEDVSRRTAIINDRRRLSKKYNSMILDEIMHMTSRRSSSGFLMTLSIFKEDFPWIYAMGKEFIEIMSSETSAEEKLTAARDFRELIDYTFNHPFMREGLTHPNENNMLWKDAAYAIYRFIDDIVEKQLN
ncbi:MAG: toll/interleukin-1 receptor domain-containing protein [Clostridiales bacterium]|nr:toll/interleukin-1 receptor domain-containing protein [Clostridiales bacterium]